MRLLLSLMLLASPALAQDALIGPDAWREMVLGKTLHYHKDGELYGREYYAPTGDRVVFTFAEGGCAEGRWAWSGDVYCFAYFGELHCFEHLMRDGDIIVKGVDDGDEQKVEAIVEDEPLFCGESVES